MKIPIVVGSFALGLVLLTAGCSEEKNASRQYGNSLTQPLKNAKSVEQKVNLAEARKSIQEFYAANGRYPADLNELSKFNGITLKSDKYDYDPATGTLTEKP